MYIYVICTGLIEETGRPPGLIFGMWEYFWPGSGKFESWKNFHTFDGTHLFGIYNYYYICAIFIMGTKLNSFNCTYIIV